MADKNVGAVLVAEAPTVSIIQSELSRRWYPRQIAKRPRWKSSQPVSCQCAYGENVCAATDRHIRHLPVSEEIKSSA